MNKGNAKLISTPIVIVEDDSDDQFLIKRIFQRMGVTVPLLFFENGKEALDYLESTSKETFMILSDINMPLMNGLELRDRINKNEELRRKSIPFIFFSTAARPADVRSAYDMTVQGFFVKEPNLESMEESLELMVNYWTKCKHPNSVHENT
jgi:CheY-like chemotaxis protein